MEIANLILEFLKVIIWPIITILILLKFKDELSSLFQKAKKINLPGGLSLETFEEQVTEAKELAKEVVEERKPKIINIISEKSKNPIDKINERMVKLGLNPSPSGLNINFYRNISLTDTRLALAGLRVDFELMLRNLAKGFKIENFEKDSINQIISKLYKKRAISSKQFRFLTIIFNLTNHAVHGKLISQHQAEEVFDLAKVLIEDYNAWLYWGFPND
ncbi:MAG: hypothetical protein JXA16_15025 [Bacteroidales bacterium]|nr:hypothetical protein [Bacteroidales bacterium]